MSYRLAEAIRIGSKDTEQVFWALRLVRHPDLWAGAGWGGWVCPELAGLTMLDPNKFVWGTCALGAAAQGMGYHSSNQVMTALLLNFPELRRVVSLPEELNGMPCPLGHDCNSQHKPQARLADQIACLNDHYHWTRERIADWVASL
jgi:hypothetical protein